MTEPPSRPRPRPFDLLLISDPSAPRGLLGSMEAALAAELPAGRVAVQLRAKGWARGPLLQAAQQLRHWTTERGLPLLVNSDHLDCGSVNADGVHLTEGAPNPTAMRQRLGPDKWLGRSCHDQAGLELCAAAADYATLSPYFEVPEKGLPLPTVQTFHLCQSAKLPVLALGGITPERVGNVIESGAWGVAVIRSVFHADHPSRQVAALLQALDVAKARSKP